MPQFVTNTMRVCTKDAANAMYDATVPVKPVYKNASAPGGRSTSPVFESDEHCSESPYNVPWSFDDAAKVENPAAMFSVGNVPMWDGTSLSTLAKYPSNGYASQLSNTNPGAAFRSWGEDVQCGDDDLLTCETDADCVGLLPGTAKVQCKHGICVMDMKQFPSCYSHADCASKDQMCSGDGRCVDMIMQVENHLDESVEFELYAKNCSSTASSDVRARSYDMYGASAWENIPDVLEMYGMCSYKDWFEYLEFVDPSDDSRKNQGRCTDASACDPATFNAFTSLWWDTQRAYAETSMQTLYDTQKFRVHAHPCDRDYQHVDGLQGCSPVFKSSMVRTGLGLVSMQRQDRVIMPMGQEYGTYVQTLQRDGYMNMMGRFVFQCCLLLLKNTKSETFVLCICRPFECMV